MVEIRTLSLQALTAGERERIAPLLPPRLEETASGKLLLTAAYQKDLPVGALLTRYYPPIHSSHIEQLYVLPDYRRQGIAKALMEESLKQLKELQIRSIEARFESASPAAEAFFKLCKHFHGSEPKVLLERYFFDPLLFTPSWLTHPPRLPEGAELFPWAELLPDEKRQLDRWMLSNPMIELLSPDQGTTAYDPLTSIGLRNESGLIGWSVTHRTAPRTLRYSAFYIHPEFRGSGAAIALLAQSIRLHSAKLPQCLGLAEIQLDNSSLFWKRFVKRRLQPLAVETNQRYSSYKIDF